MAYFKSQSSISTDYIKIYYKVHERPMLGIRILKKAVPLAVSRNSLRRNLHEIFRSHRPVGFSCAILLNITSKIPAEKKDINDILLPEWKSLLDQLR